MKNSSNFAFHRILTVFFLLLGITFFLPVNSVCAAEQPAANANTYTIYVSRKQNIINVVDNKTKKVVRSMYCSTGRNYKTIKGTYRMPEKYRWCRLNGGVYGQYSIRIHGHYMFHSVPYYRKSLTQLENNQYNKLGTQASAGCIRMAVVDAKWIYDNCPLKTKVVIGESRLLVKPDRPLLKVSTKKRAGWDPTDPNKNNPYYPVLALRDSSYTKIVLGKTFNPLKAIKYSSKFTGKDVLKEHIVVKGKVNTSKPGKYTVKYTLTDPATLLKKSLSITYQVVKAAQ